MGHARMIEMRSLPKTIGAITASAALVLSSTAAGAAPVQAAAPNAWMLLTALGPAGSAGSSAALCGTAATVAAAATQPAGGCVLPVGEAPAVAPPPGPPPPPPPLVGGPAFSGELLGILFWLPLIAIALGTSGPSGRPNSPA